MTPRWWFVPRIGSSRAGLGAHAERAGLRTKVRARWFHRQSGPHLEYIGRVVAASLGDRAQLGLGGDTTSVRRGSEHSRAARTNSGWASHISCCASRPLPYS
jgi:hypothetical protein